MITYIDKVSEFEKAVSSFQIHNPFLTKILISYKSYGLDYFYTDYWYQKTKDGFTSLIFRCDGQFVLCLTDKSDLIEISTFLNMLGFRSLLYDNKYNLNINATEQHTGVIMRLDSHEQLFTHKKINCNEKNYNFKICKENNLKRIYSFFNSMNSGDVQISEYGSFAKDLHSKIRSGCGVVYSLNKYNENQEEIVSCCITITDGYNGIIGPVATKHEYRQKDFAKSLISCINSEENCKKLFLFCMDDIRKEIYTKMGFITVGKWKEIYQ
ncbi:MAG: hypothetical protein J1F17_06630 [Oscillospiraceae bacterium]|nr:hypothetical protein [Oscillospiraceae bacterium]